MLLETFYKEWRSSLCMETDKKTVIDYNLLVEFLVSAFFMHI